jgi:hypothetical protein
LKSDNYLRNIIRNRIRPECAIKQGKENVMTLRRIANLGHAVGFTNEGGRGAKFMTPKSFVYALPLYPNR